MTPEKLTGGDLLYDLRHGFDAADLGSGVCMCRSARLSWHPIGLSSCHRPAERSLMEQDRVALLAVDEAHVISEWGEQFRLARHEGKTS